MKIIITGATGFIGQEVLSQALSRSDITSVIALSRKTLSETNAKLKAVLMQDFLKYEPDVMEQLKGADGCIWTIGAKSTDKATTKKVTVDYSRAAAKAFAQLAQESKKNFRFVFTSGVLAVSDPKKSVWLYGDVRRVAGEAETNLLSFAKENEDAFEGYVMRPAGVLSKESGVKSWLMGFGPSIRVDELSATMLDVVVNGSDTSVWENANLRSRGRELCSELRNAETEQ